MPLALLSDLKSLVDIGDASQDALLTGLLTTATGEIERYCGRVLLYVDADQVETHDGGRPSIWLKRWPVTQIVSVKEASDYDFAAATALTANDDYRAVLRRGRLIRRPDGACWLDAPDAVQVTYRGGYLDPASGSLGSVEYVPAHIQRACLLQAAYLWQRRQQLGQASVSAAGPGGVVFSQAPYELLPAVKDLLRDERRMAE